jgi:phage I-like protein
VAEFGFLVDVSTGVRLDESGEVVTSWVQAIPLGKWQHPIHGEINITSERAQRFADNVKKNVRGQDLDIDYDHKEKTGEAAGWVKDAEARADGVYLFIEWTKSAASKIKEKAYRYFSPDFFDKWEHPSLKETFEDVLAGGALTNRPFLKGILPINLSEAFAEHTDPLLGVLAKKLQEVGVDPKKLRLLLGLKEDAADADVTAALTEKGLTVDDFKAEPPKEEPTKPEDKDKEEPVQIAASEILELAKKLSESSTSPEVKQLAELVSGMGQVLDSTQKQLTTTEAAYRLAEADARVIKLNEGKKRIFAPAVTDKLKEIMVGNLQGKQLSDTVLEMFETISKDGLVELGERGYSRTGNENDKSATQRYNEAVQKYMKENANVTYADACTAVSGQDEKLFAEYRAESTSFVEN